MAEISKRKLLNLPRIFLHRKAQLEIEVTSLCTKAHCFKTTFFAVPIIVIVSRGCAVVGDSFNSKVLRCNSVSITDKIIANILGSLYAQTESLQVDGFGILMILHFCARRVNLRMLLFLLKNRVIILD